MTKTRACMLPRKFYVMFSYLFTYFCRVSKIIERIQIYNYKSHCVSVSSPFKWRFYLEDDVLVSFPIAVIKYLGKINSRENNFIQFRFPSSSSLGSTGSRNLKNLVTGNLRSRAGRKEGMMQACVHIPSPFSCSLGSNTPDSQTAYSYLN